MQIWCHFPSRSGGETAKKKKTSIKGTKTHFGKKSVVLMHEFFTSRPICGIYFKLNTAQSHPFVLNSNITHYGFMMLSQVLT